MAEILLKFYFFHSQKLVLHIQFNGDWSCLGHFIAERVFCSEKVILDKILEAMIGGYGG